MTSRVEKLYDADGNAVAWVCLHCKTRNSINERCPICLSSWITGELRKQRVVDERHKLVEELFAFVHRVHQTRFNIHSPSVHFSAADYYHMEDLMKRCQEILEGSDG